MTGDDIVDPPWPGTPSARDDLVDQLGPEAPKRRRCQRCHGIVTEEVTIVPSKGEISMPRQVYAATVVPDPLADLRILDLTNEAGVLTGRILADLGADVLMVEPPEGSAARWIAPFVDGEADRERSFRHLYFNANKRSAVLDLSSSGGQEAFRSLVHEADVLLETAMPGEREALGLGHRELRAINPGLIQVSITPFGVDSDRAAWKGNDLT
ncbi:MAG TPA: CoA transferase, partial [Dehalococcoidia bacterium]|nr:CoA transferase [Dehalococcoidia bacterium]